MTARPLTAFLLAALILLCLNGCSLKETEQKLDAVEDTVENRLDAVEDALQTGDARTPSGARLTREQAQTIALEHAGFTADQVTYLCTEFEIDEGIPQYEVQFHQGPWEYDYEINAETGAILSYDRDG